ncbi:hypothetical protein BESB_075150 [Besnoitia besnoiti]|uniref:G domain-containing protein n=1 Tax=Besnoitia besnoiti TaxID=94643 RepID=A0A2A9MFD2_BESBE|nr:uncharacterized protein BESB_075150 [Besnoitia besnoiti]PFH34363.1 hypothetical protein BESB_075150 [Besnoitia besnoiti]
MGRASGSSSVAWKPRSPYSFASSSPSVVYQPFVPSSCASPCEVSPTSLLSFPIPLFPLASSASLASLSFLASSRPLAFLSPPAPRSLFQTPPTLRRPSLMPNRKRMEREAVSSACNGLSAGACFSGFPSSVRARWSCPALCRRISASHGSCRLSSALAASPHAAEESESTQRLPASAVSSLVRQSVLGEGDRRQDNDGELARENCPPSPDCPSVCSSSSHRDLTAPSGGDRLAAARRPASTGIQVLAADDATTVQGPPARAEDVLRFGRESQGGDAAVAAEPGDARQAGSGDEAAAARGQDRSQEARPATDLTVGVETKAEHKVGDTPAPAKRKLDVRIRRRIKEIVKIMKKGETARDRLRNELKRDERIRRDPGLLAREREEQRTLRLVDPLVRPIERRRYTVQWWPNFAREALPRVLAALSHVDLLVEVRDARLPLLTQLPIRPPAGGEKPRLVVLTHADRASEAGNAQWARYFRFLYRLQAAEALHMADRLAERHGFDSRGARGAAAGEEEQTADPEAAHQRWGGAAENDARGGHAAGDSEEAEGLLLPPIPPATPVLFVNAQQGGACIVRVEKAARKIVRQWRDYQRDVETYRRRLKALAARLSRDRAPQSTSEPAEASRGDAEGTARDEPESESLRAESTARQVSLRSSPSSPSPSLASPGMARRSLRAKRPLRLLVVGMPNVGKSALCNRLLGTKKARSYNYPGVTKVLTWYRRRGTFFQSNLHRLFDCVDTPGFLPPPSSSVSRPSRRGTIISPPAGGAMPPCAASGVLPTEKKKKQESAPSVRMQHSASRTEFFLRAHPLWADDEAVRLLAACNKLPQSCLFTIEEASVALLNRLFAVWAKRPAYVPLMRLNERYGVHPLARGVTADDLSGCEFLHRLAAAKHDFCTGAASERVLTDFVKGYLGRMTLEVPPSREEVLRAFHETRAERLPLSSARRAEEAEEQERDRRRELARKTIRRTRMRGAKDRKLPSDWQCLLPEKEDDGGLVFLKYEDESRAASGEESDTATRREAGGAEGGGDGEQMVGETTGRALARKRLFFSWQGEGNLQQLEGQRDRGEGNGEPGRRSEEDMQAEGVAREALSSSAHADKQSRVGREEYRRLGEEAEETRNAGGRKIILSTASRALRPGTTLGSDTEREEPRGTRKRTREIESKNDKVASSARVKKAVVVELRSLRDLSNRKLASDLLDERLRTHVEENVWETGAFEGW